jgi:predicted HicB family RNase H-like nuclease
MSKRAGRKRLSVDMPEELHRAIQWSAHMRKITITRWIIRAAYARIKKERLFESASKE